MARQWMVSTYVAYMLYRLAFMKPQLIFIILFVWVMNKATIIYNMTYKVGC